MYRTADRLLLLLLLDRPRTVTRTGYWSIQHGTPPATRTRFPFLDARHARVFAYPIGSDV